MFSVMGTKKNEINSLLGIIAGNDLVGHEKLEINSLGIISGNDPVKNCRNNSLRSLSGRSWLW